MEGKKAAAVPFTDIAEVPTTIGTNPLSSRDQSTLNPGWLYRLLVRGLS